MVVWTSSPLIVALRNDLPFDVDVRITVNSADARRAGITVEDPGPQTVGAGRSRQVPLPAQVIGAGSFTLRLQLTTASGVAWGPVQTIQLRSTAYGAFTITMIIVAAAIVVLTASMRIYRLGKERRARIAAGMQ